MSVNGSNAQGVPAAQVVTAMPLSDSQALALASALSRRLGHEVVLDRQVDAALLGGVYVVADGQIIDRSVRRQLDDMKDSLKRRNA